MFNFQFGEVVAIPREPVKKELEVVVEIIEPTVNWEVVAMMFVPSEDAVRIAFGEKFRVAVKVPDVVTGELVTVKAAGRDSPTEVTVPEF